MATRKSASKTSARAGLNIRFDSKSTKKTGKQVEKTLKHTNKNVLIALLVLVLLGALIGVGLCWYLSRNDKFEIIGRDEITLTLGESYLNEGVAVVSFGRDMSAKVEIDTNLNRGANGEFSSDEIGTFYIVYKVNCLKYGSIFKVQKIRLITFVEPSESEEMLPNESQGGENV